MRSNDTTAKTAPLTIEVLRDRLAGFTGSEQFYRHLFGRFVYTEGVKAMADMAGAYWLIDLIGSHQPALRKRQPDGTPFQIWRLVVAPDRTAVADVREDTTMPVLLEQRIEYSDFPAGTFECYYVDDVMLLKSEY